MTVAVRGATGIAGVDPPRRPALLPADPGPPSRLQQHDAFAFDPGEHLAVLFRAVVVPVLGGEGGVVAHGDQAPAVGAHHEQGLPGILGGQPGDVVELLE